MERHHPLVSELKELLEVCSAYNIEQEKGYATFEVYQELSLVQKISNLKYTFNEKIKMFYLSGKQEITDEFESTYIPVLYRGEITPQEMNSIQEVLSPVQKQFYLLIRDRDSSSTCYCITQGLVKPDSPDTCKKKKETERRKYQLEKNILDSRKILYMKALQEEKEETRADKLV